MDQPQPQRRRRIDRIIAADYLDGLGQRSAAELRAMRDECRQEESRLSYNRRLLHGTLDIVRAELARRAGAEQAPGGLLEQLTSILADEPPAAPRAVRDAPLYDPERADGRRREDAHLADALLVRLPDLDDAEVAALAERLSGEERTISGERRTVLAHLDRLQEELMARYRDGSATVDEVVASVARPGAGGQQDPGRP
ncbi:MAG TPA: hypothetical protein VG452_00685 [Egibacteraceae bacterium]|nr:hypothetical protein [Egibacteraceae bacterium]